MAKKSNVNDREINYNIERIRTPMSREALENLNNTLKSDDDFVNYHLGLVDETHNRYKITIMNDEYKSPKKKHTGEDRSYGFMKPSEASEFLTDYIDEGKANSKPKEVMRTGYSKKSIDKYKSIVEQEALETKAVNKFTKPSFDDVLNNVYVNTYNGETYNEKDDVLPDDLRENVGFTVPGMIESIDEYFEFVKRLKDKGKGGLGRSIYDRYEDYEEACDLIEKYKDALFDKYGGQEEYFAAKDLGGMFGAYEYYPTVKPRFKKTSRNIKLDKGINLNELASVKDMGARIWECMSDEIEACEVIHSYVEYEQAPPKYRDLPEELQLVYKNDKYGNNCLDMIKSFKKIEQYANELIRSGNDNDIAEGYSILDKLRKEEIANRPYYESEFVDIIEDNDLTLGAVVSQLDYDKTLYASGYDVEGVDNVYDVSDSLVVFKNYMKDYIAEVNDLDVNDPLNKANIEELADYATKYMYDPRFRKLEDDKSELNSAGDVLYKNNKNVNITLSGGESYREKSRANESRVQQYVREIASAAKESLGKLTSNADTSDYGATPTMAMHEVVGYNSTIDVINNGFDLEPKAKALVKYMVGNELLAKRIYEVGADKDDADMFSPRTSLSEFVDKAQTETKPFMTEHMIDLALKNNKRGGLINE